MHNCHRAYRLRPHHPEHTRPRPISDAKQVCVWLVFGWETACEYQVLYDFSPLSTTCMSFVAAYDNLVTHEEVFQLLLICWQTPSYLRVSLSAAEKDHIREENVPATHQPLKPIIWLYRGTVWFHHLYNAHLSHSQSFTATPPWTCLILSDLRSQAGLALLSTWMVDHLGIPGAVSFFSSFYHLHVFCCNVWSPCDTWESWSYSVVADLLLDTKWS